MLQACEPKQGKHHPGINQSSHRESAVIVSELRELIGALQSEVEFEAAVSELGAAAGAASFGASMAANLIRFGTRKSAMALAQTEEIARRLAAAAPGLDVEIVKFETTGDRDQLGKLLPHDGKGGAFVAEIRRAVLSGELQAAMHSLKDMPGNEDTPGLVIGATLSRDPPGDVLVLRPGVSLDEIRRSHGNGFKVGTNAVRRAAYARRLFPDIEVIHFRGAADTRIRKLDHLEKQRLPDGGAVGPADALIMARSGLERVGLADRIAYEFSPQEMQPAVGQGIVAVECAARDWPTRQILALIDDQTAHRCADAEREVLWVLNGHCNSPIAGFSTIAGERMSLSATVLDHAGGVFIEASRSGPADRPRELGRAVGLELMQKGAADIIERSRPV
jgi:hydroxymethylbilane synthase